MESHGVCILNDIAQIPWYEYCNSPLVQGSNFDRSETEHNALYLVPRGCLGVNGSRKGDYEFMLQGSEDFHPEWLLRDRITRSAPGVFQRPKPSGRGSV